MTLVEHLIPGVFELSLLGRRCILQLCGCAVIPLAKICNIASVGFGKRGAGANEKKSPVLGTQNRQSTYSICVVLVRPDPAALSVSRFLLANCLLVSCIIGKRPHVLSHLMGPLLLRGFFTLQDAVDEGARANA